MLKLLQKKKKIINIFNKKSLLIFIALFAMSFSNINNVFFATAKTIKELKDGCDYQYDDAKFVNILVADLKKNDDKQLKILTLKELVKHVVVDVLGFAADNFELGTGDPAKLDYTPENFIKLLGVNYTLTSAINDQTANNTLYGEDVITSAFTKQDDALKFQLAMFIESMSEFLNIVSKKADETAYAGTADTGSDDMKKILKENKELNFSNGNVTIKNDGNNITLQKNNDTFKENIKLTDLLKVLLPVHATTFRLESGKIDTLAEAIDKLFVGLFVQENLNKYTGIDTSKIYRTTVSLSDLLNGLKNTIVINKTINQANLKSLEILVNDFIKAFGLATDDKIKTIEDFVTLVVAKTKKFDILNDIECEFDFTSVSKGTEGNDVYKVDGDVAAEYLKIHYFTEGIGSDVLAQAVKAKKDAEDAKNTAINEKNEAVRDKDTLQKKLDDLNNPAEPDSIPDLKNKIQAEKSQVTALQNEKATLISDKDTLTSKLQAANTRIQTLLGNAQPNSANNNNNTTQITKQDIDGIIENLDQQIQSESDSTKKDKLAELKAVADNLPKMHQELKDKLTGANNARTEAEKNLKAKNDELETVTKEKNALKEKVSEYEEKENSKMTKLTKGAGYSSPVTIAGAIVLTKKYCEKKIGSKNSRSNSSSSNASTDDEYSESFVNVKKVK